MKTEIPINKEFEQKYTDGIITDNIIAREFYNALMDELAGFSADEQRCILFELFGEKASDKNKCIPMMDLSDMVTIEIMANVTE